MTIRLAGHPGRREWTYDTKEMPTRQEYALWIIGAAETDNTVVPHFFLRALLLFISEVLEISTLDLTSGDLGLIRQYIVGRLIDFRPQILVNGGSHLNVNLVWSLAERNSQSQKRSDMPRNIGPDG